MKKLIGLLLTRFWIKFSRKCKDIWRLYGTLEDQRVSIGRHTYGIWPDTVRLFRKDDRVEIGNYCSIAESVQILASGEHYFDRVTTYPMKQRLLGFREEVDTISRGPVVVGSDVWVGHGATILSGVKIGNGAVIASSALVNKDVPPYAIVAGVPAKVVKYRFSEVQIQKLLKIQWWNWDEEKIKKNIDKFYADVDVFITEFEIK